MDKRLLEESDLFTQINDETGEINEFLFKEEDKFDSLLIYGIAGSGKSTLAKTICRLIPHYEGNIVFDNQQDKVQMIFQNPVKIFDFVGFVVLFYLY